MMDRELLELAAKAAGINGWFIEDDDWLGTGIAFTDEDDCNQCWNPLTDNGDAFQLAIKLAINPRVIYNYTGDDGNVVPDQVEIWSGRRYVHTISNGDIYETMRKAIVRAAAEIGKGM